MASSLVLRKAGGGVPVHFARLLRASSVSPTAVHGKCYLSTETDVSPYANENRLVDVDMRSSSSVGRRGESFSALPTIVVGILDKDLSRTTLSKYPQLYGAGQRRESYNRKLFWVTMLDTLWQSIAAFFVPLLAYWKSAVDISSIGDLWTLAIVTMVNMHLAMDDIRWYWITHATIWGSVAATFICVLIIDALPFLPGYWMLEIWDWCDKKIRKKGG